jgi:hypothetical protein
MMYIATPSAKTFTAASCAAAAAAAVVTGVLLFSPALEHCRYYTLRTSCCVCRSTVQLTCAASGRQYIGAASAWQLRCTSSLKQRVCLKVPRLDCAATDLLFDTRGRMWRCDLVKRTRKMVSISSLPDSAADMSLYALFSRLAKITL